MKQCSCGADLKDCYPSAKRCNACRAFLNEIKRERKSPINKKATNDTKRYALARVLKKHGIAS